MRALVGRIGKRTRIWLAVGLVLLIGVVLSLVLRGRSAANTAFQTAELARGELTATVGATGTVRAAQSAVLNWQTTGTVETVNAAVGDRVGKDEVLASLAMHSVPQSVLQAQSSLVSAQRALDEVLSMTSSAEAAIALKEAQDAYKKAYDYRLGLNGKQWIQEVRIKYIAGQQIPEIIWRKGYVDEQTILEADNDLALRKAELEDAEREYDRLKDGPDPAEVEAARANVQAAQATLDMAKVISPIEGTITQANTNVGDHTSIGDLAFRVDDLSELLVDVEVSEIDINTVKVGQPVFLTLDAITRDVPYNGKVHQVAQAGVVSSGAVVFTVTVEMTDPDEAVKPGMTAAVNIVVNQIAAQLLVPNRAVRLVEGQRVVYVLKDGRPVPVEITLGPSSDTVSVVAGGDLKEGDLIILNPPAFGGGPFGGGPR